MMKRIASIILWSAIVAAFIGPGTVTTAASAGAGYGMTLLWAVAFSVVATFVLQEAAARISIASGQDLAAILRTQFDSGPGRWLMLLLVPGAILLGCAAYEAGNILGGAAGAMLALDLSGGAITLTIGALAAVLLWLGSPKRIAQGLALLVAVMGLGFVALAASIAAPPGEILSGTLVPRLPEGAGIIAVALVGTTVVPYNLFLGSSLARGESLSETRFGLAVAILLGGLITGAVLVVGSALVGDFSFEALAALLEERFGVWARSAFAMGLFAAGLTSAVTAPLAAALTARGLFGAVNDPRWQADGARFRTVWLLVLLVGLGFGLTGVRPVVAIVLAQAFNGLLLPLVATYLLLAANNKDTLGAQANGLFGNVIGGLVVLAAAGLGISSIWKAAQAAFG